ncbi:hypothetical protein GCM10008910_21200 [Faecalicatena orotica]|uniref:Acyl carrier protein n=1 Tax=Faecalicatena orotica TaxID=1544 RepID=A0A2Y9C4C5_9FIRM|nr:phosphopantetheine-binding protein [Faecalicatena orotica]PWJ32348.1 acyl carrier protein [Faecalicatena orotica]SSA54182.1 acyl carrier protein [Faecalicatena orotica]
MENVESKVLELVAISYRTNKEDLTRETEIQSLSKKSLQMVGLTSLLEETFGVRITYLEASACKTIGDMIDKVNEQLK